MYTSGIRKIFSVNDIALTFNEASKLAIESGYRALEWNSIIYHINADNEFIITCFSIKDFQGE